MTKRVKQILIGLLSFGFGAASALGMIFIIGGFQALAVMGAFIGVAAWVLFTLAALGFGFSMLCGDV